MRDTSKQGELLVEKNFVVDARMILQLGRESIKDHITAVIELVKNAYDADASRVEVQILGDQDQLRITDDGVGMSEQQFDEHWLRIGYSPKKRARRSPSGARRVVGEKGVGRISADRLGRHLEVRSQSKGMPAFRALVDWDAFEVDGADISSVPVSFIREMRKGARKSPATGTELRVDGLRQSWTDDDFAALEEELSTFISPYNEDAGFQIVFGTDSEPPKNLESSLLERAHLDLKADYDGQRIHYTVLSRLNGIVPEVVGSSTIKYDAKIDIGPVEVRLLYLPRALFKQGPKGLSIADLRDKAVGVRVYRDGVRVRPYGEPKHPQGDWLQLARRKAQEPAGVARATYRMPPTELGGFIAITRDDNPLLVDTAGREGLVHNEAFDVLTDIVQECLRVLEAKRHSLYIEEKKRKRSAPAARSVEEFSAFLSNQITEWTAVSELAVTDPKRASAVANQISASAGKVAKKVQASISALLAEARMYRGLSTLGIASTVFAHETQTAIAMCVGSLAEASDEVSSRKPDMKLIGRNVARAKENAEKISAWGRFAIARTRHEKRKMKVVDVSDLAMSLVHELQPAYRAANVHVDYSNVRPATLRAFEMDIEAVVLNLLTNAYTFAQSGKGPRRIRLEIGESVNNSGKVVVVIAVADSGPGVSPELREIIWEPLYTTKRDNKGREIGTGLGLAIIDSIVHDAEGQREVRQDEILGGALFLVTLPKNEG